MTIVAIMQPTFLPWLGYFAMIEAADHFVFLDDVQFSKQSWQSRNRIKGPSGELMLSVPVARKPSKPLIREARLAETGFEAKLVQTIRQAYAKAPFGAQAADLLAEALDESGGALSGLNIKFIRAVADLIGIKAAFHTSSDMGITTAGRSARLLDLTRALKGTRYLSPVGSAAYLAEDNAFEGSDVALDFLNFEHPEYPQGRSAFLSHLAVIDALAHLGPDGVRPILQAGLKRPMTLKSVLEQT